MLGWKREEVIAAQNRLPEDRLRKQAEQRKNSRSFYQALKKPGPFGVNIISEIKRASPSKGLIRKDLDPVTYAGAYEKGGAAALSVLTDQSFFQGSPEDLKIAKGAVQLPVLRKDFTISTGMETLDVGFFSQHELPDLSTPRNTSYQIEKMFDFHFDRLHWPIID